MDECLVTRVGDESLSAIREIKGSRLSICGRIWQLRRSDMAATVAKMTKHELKEIIESTV